MAADWTVKVGDFGTSKLVRTARPVVDDLYNTAGTGSEVGLMMVTGGVPDNPGSPAWTAP